jgi:hypothetical protein
MMRKLTLAVLATMLVLVPLSASADPPGPSGWDRRVAFASGENPRLQFVSGPIAEPYKLRVFLFIPGGRPWPELTGTYTVMCDGRLVATAALSEANRRQTFRFPQEQRPQSCEVASEVSAIGLFGGTRRTYVALGVYILES